MPGLDDVLARLVNEPAYRHQLRDDPASALAGYSLEEADLEVLAAAVTDERGETGDVEARQSKSAMIGLFSQVLGMSIRGGGAEPVAQGTHSGEGGSEAVTNMSDEEKREKILELLGGENDATEYAETPEAWLKPPPPVPPDHMAQGGSGVPPPEPPVAGTPPPPKVPDGIGVWDTPAAETTNLPQGTGVWDAPAAEGGNLPQGTGVWDAPSPEAVPAEDLPEGIKVADTGAAAEVDESLGQEAADPGENGPAANR